MDLAKAVRSNPRYARMLGWGSRYPQIAELLHFSASSPGPEQFAIAVEEWQRGHPPLVPDGMIGPGTWRVMEPMTRFNAVPASPPQWLMSGGGRVGIASGPLPETVLAPRPPIPARVSMRTGSPRNRSYEAMFAPAEMALHRESLEMLSAARTLGRSHATLTWLAHDPPSPPNPMEGAGDMYGYAQFQEALRDGDIVATQVGGNRYRSNVIRSTEFRQLAELYGSDFIDEFNQAARQQWQYMREELIVDAILVISDLLLTWGMSAVARRAALAASARAAGEAVGSGIASVYRRVLAKCREFLMRVSTVRRELLRSIVRRESIPHERLVADTLVDLSDTLPGVSHYSRDIDAFGDTLPGVSEPRGALPDRPLRSGPHNEPGLRASHPPPSLDIERLSDPRNIFEDLTQEEAYQRIRHYDANVGPRYRNQAAYEGYEAEWRVLGGHRHGARPPEYGFRIVSPNGEVLYTCSFVRHPSRIPDIHGFLHPPR